MDISSILERLRQRQRERRLEDILFAHPYLIDPILVNPNKQNWLAKDSRTDLQCELEDGSIAIIELKRGGVKIEAVKQLLRYRQHIRKSGKTFRGYLVGLSLHPAALKKLQRYQADIRFLQLGIDVPTEIVICRSCRQARDARQEHCPHDGSSSILVAG